VQLSLSGVSPTELRNSIKDLLHAACFCDCCAPIVLEEFAGCVFDFGDAISYKNQAKYKHNASK